MRSVMMRSDKCGHLTTGYGLTIAKETLRGKCEAKSLAPAGGLLFVLRRVADSPAGHDGTRRAGLLVDL